MLSKLTLALTLAASASAALHSEEPTHQKFLWESFKREFRKSYATMEEEGRRFTLFLENLKAMDHRNMLERRAGGNAMHGITKFSDLSQVEFESAFLTADAHMKVGAEVDTTVRVASATTGLVDWSGVLTTPVKNQGYCGSCWAFSATEQIESDAMRTLGKTWILAPEQITQCTTGCFGCNGGFTERAFTYAKSTPIVQEADYPYTSYYGQTGTCNPPTSKGVVKVTSYTTLTSESAMASYVQSTGPLSVCLDASSWNSYTGGIMTVCGNDVDHCVQAVGVDASSSGYWKVRNSWGADWGEAGYIRLAYGKNTCDITNDPIYTGVANA